MGKRIRENGEWSIFYLQNETHDCKLRYRNREFHFVINRSLIISLSTLQTKQTFVSGTYSIS